MMNSNFDWYKWDLKWTQGSSFQCWVHTMLSFHWFDSSNSLWRLMQNDFKPSKRPVKVLKFVLYAVLLSKKLLIRGWWLLSIIYVLGPYSVSVNSCSRLSQGFSLKKFEIYRPKCRTADQTKYPIVLKRSRDIKDIEWFLDCRCITFQKNTTFIGSGILNH